MYILQGHKISMRDRANGARKERSGRSKKATARSAPVERDDSDDLGDTTALAEAQERIAELEKKLAETRKGKAESVKAD